MKAGPEAPEPSRSDPLAGLTVQNRTQPTPTMPVQQGSPSLQVWAKGSMVRVSVGHASRTVDRNLRPLVLAAAEPLDGETETAAGSNLRDRDAITVLSKWSRRRLMEKLSTIDRGADALLVTLTWPSWAAPDAETWHQSWDRWRKRLARAWPDAAGVWRREFTKVGTVHLHLILFGTSPAPASVKRFRDWTARSWADSVNAAEYERRLKAGTRVEVPRSTTGVQRYISKYVSKAAAGDAATQPMGRWWGTFNEYRMETRTTRSPSKIPYTLPESVAITEAEGHQLRRIMDRMLAAKSKATAKRQGRPGRKWQSFNRHTRRVFTDNPALWLRLLEVIRQPSTPPVGASRRGRVGEAGARATSSPATWTAIQRQRI